MGMNEVRWRDVRRGGGEIRRVSGGGAPGHTPRT